MYLRSWNISLSKCSPDFTCAGYGAHPILYWYRMLVTLSNRFLFVVVEENIAHTFN